MIDQTFQLCGQIIGFGFVVDSIARTTSMRQWWSDPLRQVSIPSPLHRTLGVDVSLDRPRTRLLLCSAVALRLVAGLLLVSTLGPLLFAAALALVGATTIKIVDPHGCDSSDQLCFAVTAALTGSQIVNAEWAKWAVLGFITFNAMVAYFMNGFFKLMSPIWRNKSAISYPANTIASGHPLLARFLARLDTRGVWLSRFVIAFELTFPLVLIAPKPIAVAFLVMMIGFHILIAVFMRLGNFVWAFGSTFPAIVACSWAFR